MKRILLVFVLTCFIFVFQACEKDQNEIEVNVINDDIKDILRMVNESAFKGVFEGSNIEEMQSVGLKRFSELSGVEYSQFGDRLPILQTKSTDLDSSGDEIINEILNLKVKEQLGKLFSVFNNLSAYYYVDEFGTELFNFDQFLIKATSHVIALDSEVLDSQHLDANDKLVYFSSSFMLLNAIESYESLSLFLSVHFEQELKSASSVVFFKKLWNGMVKVASVITTTVVSTVVNLVGSTLLGTGDDGIVDNLFCSIPGVLYGVYYGVVIGIDCDSFDVDCLIENDKYKLGCNGGY